MTEPQTAEVVVTATVYHADGSRSEYTATFPGEQISQPQFDDVILGVASVTMPDFDLPDDAGEQVTESLYTFGGGEAK